MKRTATCLVILVVTAAAGAQQTSPALMVKVGERSEPLQLALLDTKVRILGYLAETRTTMTFRNPHGRALAGELVFPLPEGATVSGYALDIQGKLIDGVVVDRPRARQVFEKIVRQGVDPGLVEWVKGNNFRTRVFPIPPRGTRTVRVDYVTDMVHTTDGFACHLPLKLPGKVGSFHLRVEVVQGAAEPVVREGGLANFKFGKWRRGYAAETTMENAALTRDLVIAIPDVARQAVLVERGPDGQHYFCLNDFPAAPPRGPRALDPPGLVTVYWDASGSRGGSDHEREIALLAKALDHLAAGAKADSTKWVGFPVDLVVFRNRAEAPRRFEWNNLNVRLPNVKYREDLLRTLREMAYDGGTQMAAISPPPGAPKPDFYFLFTDGLSNFGPEDPTDLARPVYVFSADATANHPFLRYLAMKTGGEYYNLNRLEDEAVLNSVGGPAFAFLSAWTAGAKVEETYPSRTRPVHGRFALVGKLTGDEAHVTLNYGTAGKVLTRSKFKVARSEAVEGDLLRRFWAQRKVDELSIFPKRNAKAITAVGREYSIVTPGTSLLVLESLEQYLEHRIAPPKSLAKMHAEYQRRMDTIGMQRKRQRAAKIDKVLALWRDRVAWWEKQFKYPKDFKYDPRKAAAEEAVPLATPALARPARPPGRPPEPGTPETPAPADVPAGGETTRRGQPGVLIKAWDPKTPYLAALRRAAPGERFAVYMAQRERHGTSPAFFLDCAEFFRAAGEMDLAVQVLSNVAEMELDNAALVRVLAHKLAQWRFLEPAVLLFERALEMRPEEPQSYRDLALVLARREQYARAIELLHEVVMKPWDERFGEVEAVALMELNRLIPRAQAAGVDVAKLRVDPRLVKLLDVDCRVVLTWDADMTDIDLHVTEPSGEKVYYSHNRSTIGGRISRDFTRGYGPEEYVLRKAPSGVFQVHVNYFGTSAARLLGAVTLQVDIFTNYGRANEQHKAIIRRLRTKKETLKIGEVEF